MSDPLPQNPSVLIVEDERVFAMDLKQMLSDMGYLPFAIASSCDEAIAQASAKCPDIVLMDIRIEGPVDGIETAEVLKEKFDLPVIFLTAHADEATIQRAARTTPYGYLLKPVKSAELQSSVAVALIRHQIEKRLREREQWFSKALRSFADSLVTADGAVNTRFIDPIAGALVGERSGEALGQRTQEVLKLLDDHSVEHSSQQLAALSSIFSRDIAEWRRADERANLLASIVESSDDAIFSWTLEGIIASWNRGAKVIYGYDPDEIIGQPISRLIHPDRPGELEGLLIRIRRGEHIRHYETVRLRKDGSTVSISLAASPMLDATGRLTGVSAICRDITDWKRANQRANLLASIADNSDDAIFSWTLEGIITSWNRGAHVVYGYDSDEIIGQPISRLIHPDRPGELDELTARIRRGEHIRHYETIRLRKDGSTVSISLAASPMLDTTGGLIGISAICRDITEWKRAKSKVEFLASIVETSDDAILSWNTEKIITSWNRGAQAMLGYSPDEIIGQPISRLSPPECSGEAEQFLEQIRRGEPIRRYETTRLRKDDTRISVSLTASPIFDSAGFLAGLSIIGRDVTERRVAEEKIRLAEERNRIFADCVRDFALFMIDPRGHVTTWNQGAERLKGYRAEEIVGKHIEIFYPPEAVAAGKVQGELETATRTGECVDEGWRIRKDGSRFWARVVITALRDNNGELRGFNKLTRDITETKRAADRLQESELRFRTLTETIPQLIWSTRPDGSADYFGRQWIDFTGIPEKQQLGSGWLSVLHPDDRQRIQDIWLRVAPLGEKYDVEYRIRSRDGEYRWFKARGVPMRDSSGQVIQWFGSSTDIQEQKELEQALHKREQELQRSNGELQEFAYVASHDLQEPLRMVANYTELLAQRYRGKLDADADEFIAFAVDGARRMQNLIEDLLSYSRVGTRAKPFRPARSADIVQRVLKSLAVATAESHATVEVTDLPEILCDESQLESVFQNLLGNALKFCPKSRSCRIEISARTQGAHCVFSVRDNGIGIEARHFERIFRTFQRLHTREEYPGNGIGLAICKKVVERHGGRIWLESKPGEGTTFFFTVPVAPVQVLEEVVANDPVRN